MGDSNVPENIINARRGFAEMKGQARPTEETDIVNTAGGQASIKLEAVPWLLRTTKSRSINGEKPVINLTTALAAISSYKSA